MILAQREKAAAELTAIRALMEQFGNNQKAKRIVEGLVAKTRELAEIRALADQSLAEPSQSAVPPLPACRGV